MEGRGEKRKKKDQEKKELFIFFGFRLRNSSSAIIQFKFHSIFVLFSNWREKNTKDIEFETR